MTLRILRLQQPPELRWRVSDTAYPGLCVEGAFPIKAWQGVKSKGPEAIRSAVAALLFDLSMELDGLIKQVDEL